MINTIYEYIKNNLPVGTTPKYGLPTWQASQTGAGVEFVLIPKSKDDVKFILVSHLQYNSRGLGGGTTARLVDAKNATKDLIRFFDGPGTHFNNVVEFPYLSVGNGLNLTLTRDTFQFSIFYTQVYI